MPRAATQQAITGSADRLDAVRTIPFGRPMISDRERQAVMAVLEGTVLTHGPLVRRFESEFAAFTGADHAVATSSCAAALHLAGLALGIGPGDEVLVSAQTHVSTAHAMELCGARCVFVDSEPMTGNMDPDALEAAVTPATRAIALVHFIGIPAPVHRILSVARKHHLAVIEDCALALGATIEGTHVGLFGDAGCFSFYPIKHITTIEGGLLITRRRDVAGHAARARAFGIERNPASGCGTPGLYDVPLLGCNYRMSEPAAALGVEQLQRLPDFLAARRRNFRLLADGLAGLEGVRVLGGTVDPAVCGCYCLVLMLDERLGRQRRRLIESLNRRGVGTSVYYPRPAPAMTYYREKYGTGEEGFPNAWAISNSSIALPVGPHVTEDDVSYMVSAVTAAIREISYRCLS